MHEDKFQVNNSKGCMEAKRNAKNEYFKSNAFMN